MKMIKRLCLIFMFILIMLITSGLFNFFYRSVDMIYLGSAKGILDSRFYSVPEYCMENDFLYYNMGYAVLDDKAVSRCDMSDFDFQLEEKEGKICVYSYGFPIEKLMYNKTRTSKQGNYYNKAVFSKDKFKDGVYYFYETDYIPIGDWSGEPLDYSLYLMEEDDRDDFQVSLVVLIIVFFMLYCLNMDIPVHRFEFFILFSSLLRFLHSY